MAEGCVIRVLLKGHLSNSFLFLSLFCVAEGLVHFTCVTQELGQELASMTHFDERSGVVPALTPWGSWYQTIEEVVVLVNVAAGTRGRDVSVTWTVIAVAHFWAILFTACLLCLSAGCCPTRHAALSVADLQLFAPHADTCLAQA